jgi:hypothetical protein
MAATLALSLAGQADASGRGLWRVHAIACANTTSISVPEWGAVLM